MTKPKNKTKVTKDLRQIPLRLPITLFQILEALSEKEKRSVNSQIEFMLEADLKSKGLI